jgi:hypothetical protein
MDTASGRTLPDDLTQLGADIPQSHPSHLNGKTGIYSGITTISLGSIHAFVLSGSKTRGFASAFWPCFIERNQPQLADGARRKRPPCGVCEWKCPEFYRHANGPTWSEFPSVAPAAIPPAAKGGTDLLEDSPGLHPKIGCRAG